MDPITGIVLTLVLAGVGYLILFYVVKAATLAALSEDRRNRARAERELSVRAGGGSHVDADGR